MVKVAVAGGTSAIGLHIVDALLATGKHDVLVLSRKPAPHVTALGAQLAVVSYTDADGLAAALAGVHTVISAIGGTDHAILVAPQLALLAASVRAGVRRFAPSEWAAYRAPGIELYRLKEAVEDAVAASGLEYTLFLPGGFANYLASGTRGVGHLQPLKFIWDVESCTARVPGDGSRCLVLTTAEDVGRFVAASLELPKWPRESRMMGDRKTINEILQLAEAVRGRKFDVTYVSAEELEQQIAADKTEGWSAPRFFAQCLLCILRTDAFAWEDAELNELCPQVKPVNVEDFLRQWWACDQ